MTESAPEPTTGAGALGEVMGAVAAAVMIGTYVGHSTAWEWKKNRDPSTKKPAFLIL